ncbi:MAG: hypothetical protein WBS24_03315 [Terriglobales bacterium]
MSSARERPLAQTGAAFRRDIDDLPNMLLHRRIGVKMIDVPDRPPGLVTSSG